MKNIETKKITKYIETNIFSPPKKEWVHIRIFYRSCGLKDCIKNFKQQIYDVVDDLAPVYCLYWKREPEIEYAFFNGKKIYSIYCRFAVRRFENVKFVKSTKRHITKMNNATPVYGELPMPDKKFYER